MIIFGASDDVMPMLEEIGVPELGEPGAAGIERKEGDRVFLKMGVGEKTGLQEGQRFGFVVAGRYVGDSLNEGGATTR